jgi:hypothetical protein
MSILFRSIAQGVKEIAGAWHQNTVEQRKLRHLPAPSSADAQLQQWLADELQLAEAWITNGVNTIRIPQSDFFRFRATGGDR